MTIGVCYRFSTTEFLNRNKNIDIFGLMNILLFDVSCQLHT